MTANQTQIGGTHYKDMPIQPWDAMQAWMTEQQFAGYLLGNVIKYVARHPAKGGVEDLKKARHYLDKLIEVRDQGRAAGAELLRDALDKYDSAVSESAAGGTCPQPGCQCGGTLPTAWPGPDWSQAPSGATAWAAAPAWSLTFETHSTEMGGVWLFGPHDAPSDAVPAPLFGYTGDWRDSLRKRPA